MNEALDRDEIVAALKREFEDAEQFYTSELQPEVEAANNYYEARPFGDEEPGRSQIVLPDVAEAIDYMGISVLRTFLSSERVVEIEEVQEEDKQGAEEATAAVHYNFMREQDGGRLLGDWLQSGLLERIGVMKTACETVEKVSRTRVSVDMETAQAIDAGLLLGEGQEVEGIEQQDDGSLLIEIKTTKIEKRFFDVTLPLEEYRFSRNARHEDDADYQAHVCLKTRSELVEMGFDREQVADLPIADDIGLGDQWRDQWRDSSDQPPELQTVLFCEEYARMDVDNDGIAERVKVCRVGDEILRYADGGEALETITEHCFTVFCPFPRANRLVGNSLADKVMDIQRIRSVIARQMNDAMFLGNMPRPLIDMTNEYAATTIEDVLRPIAGSPIRYKGTPPQPFQSGLDVSKSLSVLEHWTGERETRTGITRINQGLDADTLNKTATGAALISAQGQQMEESIARTFGAAFGRLVAKKIRLMKAEGATFPIKVDGQYRVANAANWPEEFNLLIRVGLGTGRNDERLQRLFALGQMIERAMPTGEIKPGAVSKLISETVSAMQLGQADQYVYSPEELAQLPQQDEGQAMAQAEMAKAEAKAQGDMMKAQVKAQTDLAKVQAQTENDRLRMMSEAELRREEMALEARLKMIGMASDARAAEIRDTSDGGSLAA